MHGAGASARDLHQANMAQGQVGCKMLGASLKAPLMRSDRAQPWCASGKIFTPEISTPGLDAGRQVYLPTCHGRANEKQLSTGDRRQLSTEIGDLRVDQRSSKIRCQVGSEPT